MVFYSIFHIYGFYIVWVKIFEYKLLYRLGKLRSLYKPKILADQTDTLNKDLSYYGSSNKNCKQLKPTGSLNIELYSYIL